MAGCAPTPRGRPFPGDRSHIRNVSRARRGDVLSHVRGGLSASESLGHLIHEAVAAA